MTEIHPSAVIHPAAQISDNVKIGPYSVCGENVSIGSGTTIGAHVVLDGWCRIGEHNTIHTGAVIGSPPQDMKYKGEKTKLTIGNHNVIREFVTLNIGTKGGGGETKVGDGNLLMAYSHVAHDCIIGNRVVMANAATLGGHVVLEDGVIMSGLSGVHHFVRIGSLSIVGGCSKVLVDIPPYCMVDGRPAKVRGLNVIGLRRSKVPLETRNALKEAYRLLYRSELNIDKALEKIAAEVPDNPEVRHVVEFIKETARGKSGRALQPK
jgi:UDP-N-acetylglucosamine acyltransferase